MKALLHYCRQILRTRYQSCTGLELWDRRNSFELDIWFCPTGGVEVGTSESKFGLDLGEKIMNHSFEDDTITTMVNG